ncbi:ribosome small subunit-dependent GTPase A [Allonocardiopsis opalescens]|uniref:Small ribosomal subunit biogenesis GTPase RsgA n=1 Tax=Allonocardiopsis opalescens TaxID=1144618 RepID=A0A2T0QDU6_9ACTN|nr:ribosome small subunit-dependent GTPase A [Allonocardiopsis opalescens]PRY02041.1 ribosome biogenesis GTPase [Allonocardiopsis opalescens]
MGVDAGGRVLTRRRYVDEDSVRVRPRPGSRPRTRTRPSHDDAAEGRVVTVDRGRYTCLVEERSVTAMKARELGRGSIVVGDRVRLVGDLSGRPDTLARVVRVEDRASVLRRTADDTDPVERVIVANADQLVIVTSLADPPIRPRFVDRCLVAAFDADLLPLLCLTKSDLAEPGDLADLYRELEVPCVVTGRGGSLDELRTHLTGRSSVFIGSSGVGKSTLVNALVPDADRAVGGVNPVTGRGRHTSTSAVAFPLPADSGGGWIVDTPGVRSFGLAHVDPQTVAAAFPDLVEATADCPPGCDHLTPDCALDAWVARGNARATRLDSLRRLLTNRPDDEP